MGKILVTATNANVYHFLIPHIEELISHGHTVDLACTNLSGYDVLLMQRIVNLNVSVKYVRLERSPFSLSNYKGVADLKKIIDDGNYDLIWTNEPVMSIGTRLAALKARRKGTIVVYMAHGFHFFKGSSLISWIVYYPVEKFMARFADILITINKEDFERGHSFAFKEVYYVHGVGLDTAKFETTIVDRIKKREEIGIPQDAIMLFSVGELGSRKNHEVIIDALYRLHNKDLYYVICGEGVLEEYLKDKSKKLGLADNIKFLGYRRDIPELCKTADIYVFPSQREGLGIGALEGMASGLPLISSYVNGIRDYTEDRKTGYTVLPHDIDGFATAIDMMYKNKDFREQCGKYNICVAKKFDVKNTRVEIFKILNNALKGR